MLLVDIGNSRVKWARWERGVLGAQSAAAYAGWSPEDWRRELFGGKPVDRVVVASVSGPACREVFADATRHSIGRTAEFVATSRETAGVRNGYADPGQLGVDRWVAVIGAWHRVRNACVVADVGTALTVDVVRADGQHLGGYIVPGPRLMVSSLHSGTSDLEALSAASPDTASVAFAASTRGAIERGCRVAGAALIDRSVADAATALGSPPILLLTGGAASELRPYLRTCCDEVPDLVLRGLGAWAETMQPADRAE
jgi:type III pantothenate kinase